MKKNKWTNALKAIIFAFLIIFIVSFTFWLFSPKEMAFYDEPADSYDVLFFGSSTVYTAINPVVLFQQSGIRSYNLARPEQSISLSYYYMQEAVKYQKPKLIVLDLYAFFFYGDYPDDINPAGGVTAASLEGMKLSEVKRSAVKATVADKSEWNDYLLPWFSAHNDWETGLGESSYKADESEFLGYVPVYSYEDKELAAAQNPYSETWASKLNNANIAYLTKIISFCNKNDIELLLIKTPQVPDWNYTVNSRIGLRNFAEEEHIAILDFNGNEEFDGVMDYSRDFSDGTHMSVYGAQHFSAALAKYIAANYDIEDIRGTDEAGSWEKLAEKYTAARSAGLKAYADSQKGDDGEPTDVSDKDDTADSGTGSIWPWVTADEDFIEWIIDRLIVLDTQKTGR